jgi:hypothetical protein
MAIKHVAVKASGEAGYASEWNDDHVIDGDVDFLQYQAVNLVFEGLAAPPAGPIMGQTYFDTALLQWRVWDGTTWLSYAGVDVSVFTRHDGSVAFTGEQSMGTHKLTNVVDPTLAQDAATKNYVDTKISFVKGSTGYWSAAGIAFIPKESASDNVYISGAGAELEWVGSGLASVEARTGVNFFCPVNLPHGAVVTGAIVYGEDAAETWTLYRKSISNSASYSTMATANIDTEDTTISDATIDNSNYCYVFITSTFEAGEQVDGARITFTYP